MSTTSAAPVSRVVDEADDDRFDIHRFPDTVPFDFIRPLWLRWPLALLWFFAVMVLLVISGAFLGLAAAAAAVGLGLVPDSLGPTIALSMVIVGAGGLPTVILVAAIKSESRR